MTDRELLIQAAAGREAAFTELYGRYGKRLRAFFLKRSVEVAITDDLRQQVFLQLLDSEAFRRPLSGPDSLEALLFSIAGNVHKNHLRSKARAGRREQVYLSNSNGEPPPPAVPPEQIDVALASLPESQRVCVTLRFRRGLSVAEIAELTGSPAGTVKSRLHYGLKKLAALLQSSANDLA